MPKIDLGNFAEVGAVPPPGWYRILFEDKAKLEQTAAKDGYNITAMWKIIDAPTGAENFENFESKAFFSLKVSARVFLKRNFEAIFQTTFDDEDFQIEYDDDNVITDEKVNFEGVTVMVLLKQGEYKGQPQAQIDTWVVDDGETQPQVLVESADDPFED